MKDKNASTFLRKELKKLNKSMESLTKYELFGIAWKGGYKEGYNDALNRVAERMYGKNFKEK